MEALLERTTNFFETVVPAEPLRVCAAWAEARRAGKRNYSAGRPLRERAHEGPPQECEAPDDELWERAARLGWHPRSVGLLDEPTAAALWASTAGRNEVREAFYALAGGLRASPSLRAASDSDLIHLAALGQGWAKAAGDTPDIFEFLKLHEFQPVDLEELLRS